MAFPLSLKVARTDCLPLSSDKDGATIPCSRLPRFRSTIIFTSDFQTFKENIPLLITMITFRNAIFSSLTMEGL
jgi:hypothetical protein